MGARTIMARDPGPGSHPLKPHMRLALRDAVTTFSEDHGLTKDRDPIETLKLALA